VGCCMSAAANFDRLSLTDIANALSYVDAHDRDTWVTMGMAVKAELGETGFSIWDSWSASAANYNQADARDVWKSIKANGKISIASLIKSARDAGYEFDNKRAEISDEELEARRARIRAEAAIAAKELAEKHAKAAEKAQAIWDKTSTDGLSAHPYPAKKGIEIAGLARVGDWPAWDATNKKAVTIPNALIIPIRNADRVLTSLQAIFPDSNNPLGRDRTYLYGGEKAGGYTNIGVPPKVDNPVILICEGYATGETLHAATGHCVFVAFDAGNLESAAIIARQKSPKARIVVCADDDKWGKDPHAGFRFGTKAAAAVGGQVIMPIFADLSTKPTDFNDLAALDGIDQVLKQINSLINPRPAVVATEPVAANDNDDDQPVGYGLRDFFTVMGYNREVLYFFQHEARQLFTLSRGDLSENALLSLAPLIAWQTSYPHKTKDFDKTAAVDDLIRSARRLPVFNPSRIRGRGACTDDGRSVFHFGGNLLVDGQRKKLGGIKSKYIYQAEVPFDIDEDVEELTDFEGSQLVDVAELFRWSKPASAPLLAGWCFLSPLCGAIKWRPHIWMTGGAGCGKTTIMESYVHLLTGWCNVNAAGNSTEAGIRQTLGSDAVPVLFDESEQNNDREESRVQNIISLIRQSSSESGAKTLKGTTSGKSMDFQVRSMFALSSIQVGMKGQADYDRLTILALRSKPNKGTPEELDSSRQWSVISDVLYKMGRDRTLPDRMFKRSVGMLPVILATIDVFVMVAGRHFGNQREGDQYGTMMAGAWCLMNARVPSELEATQMIQKYDWNEYTQQAQVDDSQRALGALLEAKIRSVHGHDWSIYELVDKIAHEDIVSRSVAEPPACGMSRSDCAATLQRCGMVVKDGELKISNTSEAFNKLMAGTQFSADLRRLLSRINGVNKAAGQHWINGGNTRCMGIPLSLIV
jgi:putative DNA primase/helicase